MIKIITFLGDRGAFETSYQFENRVYTGDVFAEALHQFCEYDEMLVCVTEKAKEKTWPVLQKLESDKIKSIDIPTGRTTDEMWETFRIITENVDENDRVIFDITHGLRSLPFLSFLFSAYLKSAKNVTIDAIYYGALELGDRNNNVPAPVINLSEFISMIDWITATNQFIQTGDARELSTLLPSNDNATKKAAKTLLDVSLATLLCQPIELSKQAKKLEPELIKAQKKLKDTVPPFELLSKKITTTFNNFTGDFSEKDYKDGLKSQFKLIEWYLDNNRLMEGMSLGREWLINAVTYRLGLSFTLKEKEREEIAKAISGIEMVSCNRLAVEELNEYGSTIYKTWTEKKLLAQFWNVLQPIRNTLDHAGHQQSALSIKTILSNTDKLRQLLHELVEYWDLED